MNLILKILQGPNAGAEIALIEGVNLKLGKGDECDIVLSDQSLPDVACEIEVGAERVQLLLPGGGQERLDPLHVKVFETTAIAIGPADEPWGPLVWPQPEVEKKEEEPEEKSEKPAVAPPPQKFRRLQIALLVVLLLVVLLEFVLWLFWPYFNAKVVKLREYCGEKYRKWTEDKLELAAQPVMRKNLEDLAKAYGVEAVAASENPEDDSGMTIRGNLKTASERLRLTAEAYSMKPGVKLELTDNESFKRAASDIIDMTAGSALKIVKAENREIVLSGHLDELSELQRVLEALRTDVQHIEKLDCAQVEIGSPKTAAAAAAPVKVDDEPERIEVIAIPKVKPEEPQKPAEPQQTAAPQQAAEQKKPEVEPKPTVARLPIVGVMTSPIPHLVLRNGSRVLEGAEFGGFVISKISEDVILLRNGDETIEWRP